MYSRVFKQSFVLLCCIPTQAVALHRQLNYLHVSRLLFHFFTFTHSHTNMHTIIHTHTHTEQHTHTQTQTKKNQKLKKTSNKKINKKHCCGVLKASHVFSSSSSQVELTDT